MATSNSASAAPPSDAQHTTEPGEGFSLVRRAVQREMYTLVHCAQLLRQRLELSDTGNDVAEIAACSALRAHDVVIASPRALGAHIARGISLPEIAANAIHTENSGVGGAQSLAIATGQAVTQLVGHSSSVALVCCESFDGDHEWRSVLRFAGQHKLPVLFIFRNHQSATGARMFDLRGTFAEFGVPAITVDAVDAVAVYRVATEACHNARIGRGATVIDAISIDSASRFASGNPLVLLESYMRRHSAWSDTWLLDMQASERRAIESIKI